MSTTKHRRTAWPTLGLWVFFLGIALLLMALADVSERRDAQRSARAWLDAEADALMHTPVAPQAETPAVRPRPEPGAVVGRIVVPRLSVDVVAFEGVDRATLDRGAGHFPGSALPGDPGNSSFAAHRDVEFRGLRRIRAGDDIWIETGDATFVYTVAETRVVEPAKVEVLEAGGHSELTLITCHPFDWVGPAPDRFVVTAHLRGRFEAADRILEDVLAAGGS